MVSYDDDAAPMENKFAKVVPPFFSAPKKIDFLQKRMLIFPNDLTPFFHLTSRTNRFKIPIRTPETINSSW